jgi:hypothetical protein
MEASSSGPDPAAGVEAEQGGATRASCSSPSCGSRDPARCYAQGGAARLGASARDPDAVGARRRRVVQPASMRLFGLWNRTTSRVREDVESGPSGYTQAGRVDVGEKRINFLAETLSKL